MLRERSVEEILKQLDTADTMTKIQLLIANEILVGERECQYCLNSMVKKNKRW